MALLTVLFFAVYSLFAVSFLGLQIIVATAVYRHAKALPSPAMGLSPVVWSLMALIAPGVGMLCYWLMNHPALRSEA